MSLFDYLTVHEKKSLKKTEMPDFIQPMLATLTERRFSDKNWIFERKLDGERCLLLKKGTHIILKSRNNKILNNSYPEIIDEAKKLNLPNCILDGEIVSFKKKETSFSLLQERFGVSNITEDFMKRIPVSYCIFDIIYYDNYLITHLPLLTRKNILKELIPLQGILQYVIHKKEKGELYFKQACSSKWEGLIAKKSDSTYISKRSQNWLKFKCSAEQELIIGGYTSPGGARINFGALLLGYYKNNILHYAGKVGTGFNEKTLKTLGALLKKNKIKTCPFDNYDASTRNVHWVKPILVCEIKFTEWTRDNKLRHSSYLGLRNDKDAKEVVQEI
jgi:DNA ligase D-like protein (predicted ligase)